MSDFFSGIMRKLYGSSGGRSSSAIFLFNTLTGKKELFQPLREGNVGMYHCGPTVYDFAHIGNLRAYVFADTLKRLFLYQGFKVKQVINITDVGHLTDDADQGEDKVELGARRLGKSAKEITDKFTASFLEDLAALNVDTNRTLFPRATEHIAEQIAFIKTLEEKGYVYLTPDGVYFDTSLFKRYGVLGGVNLAGLKEGARVEKNPNKRNPTDFALWKFSPKDVRREQEWAAPWGTGFPGWHIECSVMSMKYLGRTFDIHTGGVDHIPIHHNNEIAQSESLSGRPFVRYWLHVEHLRVEGRKISKSLGNTIFLKNLVDRGYSPLALRYLFLTTHYRSPENFTWEALEAAQKAIFKAHRHFVEDLGLKNGKILTDYQKSFFDRVADDLNLPDALAVFWELVKDQKLAKPDKRVTILDFDRILGLGFSESAEELARMTGRRIPLDVLPSAVAKMVTEREEARQSKDWPRADRLREKIIESGYFLEDTPQGVIIREGGGRKKF
jgi:cysteinyl-tRNA synthetase